MFFWSLQTSLVCIVGNLAGGGSVAAAVDLSVFHLFGSVLYILKYFMGTVRYENNVRFY